MLDFTKELCPDRPLIHPTSQTKNCRFGRYVEIGDHCVLEETEVGDYTYCFGSNDIILYRPGQVQLHCHRRAHQPGAAPGQAPGGGPPLYLPLLPLRAGAG